jgi:hypothetical protein
MSALEAIAPSTLGLEPADAGSRARALPLQHGRSLSLVASGVDDLVEIRSAAGALELRVRMTPEGPVLQMESLRLSLKAAHEVEIDCANFSVRSREAMTLQSDGALRISGETDLHVDAQGEVHVKGSMIHLN